MSVDGRAALKRVDGIVPGFLTCGPRDLLDLLGGPTLMRLESKAKGGVHEALFVSLLLHGNETAVSTSCSAY